MGGRLLAARAATYDRLMTHAADKTNSPSRRPRIIVLGAGQKAGVAEGAEALRPVLEHHADIAVWDMSFGADLSNVDAEWVVVFGGDGSILRAANQMGYRQRPILGVNLGRLGFLADLEPSELPAVLPQVCAGGLRVVEHLMFECSLVRGGEVLWTELGLNETAVLGGEPFVMLDVHLYVDAQWVTSYSCDGLIVSTPVGSTAHNLSAGGPILRQDLRAFVISPISPHTLTMRPVVDSADRAYELCVPSPNRGTHAVVDGRAKGPLEAGDCLRIRAAEPRFRLIEAPEHSYYQTLRQKLGWGGRFPTKDPSGGNA
jgi:NAD+ kinase